MYAYAHMHVLHAKAFCVWMSIFAVFRVDLNKTLESDRDRAPPKSDNLYFCTRHKQLILTAAHMEVWIVHAYTAYI